MIDVPATLQCGAVVTIKDWDTPKIDIHPDGHITLTPALRHLLPPNTSKLPTRHCGQDRPNNPHTEA